MVGSELPDRFRGTQRSQNSMFTRMMSQRCIPCTQTESTEILCHVNTQTALWVVPFAHAPDSIAYIIMIKQKWTIRSLTSCRNPKWQVSEQKNRKAVRTRAARPLLSHWLKSASNDRARWEHFRRSSPVAGKKGMQCTMQGFLGSVHEPQRVPVWWGLYSARSCPREAGNVSSHTSTQSLHSVPHLKTGTTDITRPDISPAKLVKETFFYSICRQKKQILD